MDTDLCELTHIRGFNSLFVLLIATQILSGKSNPLFVGLGTDLVNYVHHQSYELH